MAHHGKTSATKPDHLTLMPPVPHGRKLSSDLYSVPWHTHTHTLSFTVVPGMSPGPSPLPISSKSKKMSTGKDAPPWPSLTRVALT